MKILHYFLGFPPYRTGGMTSFAYDLMNSQVSEGNEVIAIWPGKMNFLFFKRKVLIKKKKDYGEIINYEIINALPIPLDEGIKNVEPYMIPCDVNIFVDFLKKINPKLIHIHTLMGLHKELIDAANKLKIKTIFTTHDYFGICPKVVLFKDNNVCDFDDNCRECVDCNKNALSIGKIKIMQSPIYRLLKNTIIVKFLRKKHRNKFFINNKENISNKNNKKNSNNNDNYKKLRMYYKDILENISLIHFNSTLSKEVYLKYIKPQDYRVIPISNKEIQDNKNNAKNKSSVIRFTFLASNKPYKGLYFIKEVLDELYGKLDYKFELNVYTSVVDPSAYMKIYENGFKRSELSLIFSNTDILIAPSLWYETFGYTVLEAMSYGVPVIVSNTVGSKDIVENMGYIYSTRDELISILTKINIEEIDSMHSKIVEKFHVLSWKEFCEKMIKLYEEKK